MQNIFLKVTKLVNMPSWKTAQGYFPSSCEHPQVDIYFAEHKPKCQGTQPKLYASELPETLSILIIWEQDNPLGQGSAILFL